MPFVRKQLDGEGRFGANLRELRELRGFSREQLSEMTKIHVSVIKALEEERVDELLDPSYAERHVRVIIRALDGRPAYFLPKYHELVAKARDERKPEFLPRPRIRRRDLMVTSHLVALGGFLVLVLLSAGYLVWQARLVQEPPPLVIHTPSDGQRLEEPRVEVRGQTVAGAVVTVNGRDAVVNPSGEFYVTFDVPRGLTTLTIEARRRYGSSIEETRRVTYLHETTTSTSE